MKKKWMHERRSMTMCRLAAHTCCSDTAAGRLKFFIHVVERRDWKSSTIRFSHSIIFYVICLRCRNQISSSASRLSDVAMDAAKARSGRAIQWHFAEYLLTQFIFLNWSTIVMFTLKTLSQCSSNRQLNVHDFVPINKHNSNSLKIITELK